MIDKAKVREREHEIIYERKLAKERSKEDHLFADKDKFVTGAYKRKLAEQAKWLEEERLRQLREEKEDVSCPFFQYSCNIIHGQIKQVGSLIVHYNTLLYSKLLKYHCK